MADDKAAMPPDMLVRNATGTFVDAKTLRTADDAEAMRLVWNPDEASYDAAVPGASQIASVPKALFRLGNTGAAASRFADAARLPAEQRERLRDERFVAVATPSVRPAELIQRGNGTFMAADTVAPEERAGRLRLAWNGARNRYDIAELGDQAQDAVPHRLVDLAVDRKGRVFADARRLPDGAGGVLDQRRFVDIHVDVVMRETARAATGRLGKRKAADGPDRPDDKRLRTEDRDVARLRHRAETLQDRIYKMAIPDSGLATPSASAEGPRPSARTQAVAGIVRTRPDRYAYHVVNAILPLPRGEEKMRCIGTLAPAMDAFPEKLRHTLLEWTLQHAIDRQASGGERIEAHKFLTVARAHGGEAFQNAHRSAFARLAPAVRDTVFRAVLDNEADVSGRFASLDGRRQDRPPAEVLDGIEHELDRAPTDMPTLQRSAATIGHVLEQLDRCARTDLQRPPPASRPDRFTGGPPLPREARAGR